MDVDGLTYHYQITKLWGEEKLSRYQPGGYQPVHLGDTFHEGRYKVVHKLGWGGFSTVWLARDTEQQRWVSLKILTAECTTRSRELEILCSLQEDDFGNNVVRLLDSFAHTGPNGTHQCLVLELLGPSVDHVIRNDYTPEEPLDPYIILRITRQLLQGLAFVHAAGPKNVAFTSSCFNECSEEELTEVLGLPETEALDAKDGAALPPSLPRYVVGSTNWDSWIFEEDEDVRLIDWGEAFAQDAAPAKIAQPFNLTAPETLFTTTSHVDYRIDLWRAGCIIYMLVFAQYPFTAYGLDGLAGSMINFVEDLPAAWRPKWEETKRTSTNTLNGALEKEKPEVPRLERKFRELVHDPKLQCLLPIMQGLLRFLPEDRISAADALDLALHQEVLTES